MGISMTQLLIVFVIVLLLFGTKKLRNIGSDIGGAVKGFRDSMKDGEKGAADSETAPVQEPQKIVHDSQGRVINGEVTDKSKEHDKA